MSTFSAPLAIEDLHIYKLAEQEATDTSHQHGSRGGYDGGCRGPMCTFANSFRRYTTDYDDLMAYITVTMWMKANPGVDIARAPAMIMRMYFKVERINLLKSAGS